jgi:hypothetical protein
MTAKELIAYLGRFPEDTEVQIAGTTTEKNETIQTLFCTTDIDNVPTKPIVLSAWHATTNEYA